MSTFAAPGSATSGLQGYDLEGAEQNKATQKEAHYVSDSQGKDPCSTCTMFRGPSSCTAVQGKISPNGHCKYYERLVYKTVTPKAAGIILATEDGKMLFLKRSTEGDHPETWSIPGGMIEPNETAEQAAIRELWEETGYKLPPGDRRKIVTVDGPVPFSTFFQRIGKETFEPQLNKEHTEHRWLAPDGPPSPLHPGLRTAMSHVISEVTQFTMKAAAMENLALFVPLLKVDVKQRMVYGTAIAEVPDRVNEIFDYNSSKPNFIKWSDGISKATDGKSMGNLRSMHGKVAAGKIVDLQFDDKRRAIDVAAKVIDEEEWRKVEEGVYSGFSIGGRYEKRWKEGDLTRYTAVPSELSLVDLPCVPGATFTMIKMDGSEEQRNIKGREPEVITNDDIIKRAGEIAKKVGGDERDWTVYVTEARKQLTDEVEARRTSVTSVVEKLDADVKDSLEKRDEADSQDTPRASGDGDWEQVWTSKRLPGKTFAKKADMLKALAEKNAEDELARKAAPVLAALEGQKKAEKIVVKVWGSNAELPSSVKGLPDHAQSVFREAANGAIKSGKDDESAMKIGWTAVKNGWTKKGDTWVRKESKKGYADGALLKREYSSDQRSKYAKQGVAMKDGSFPIPDKSALSDAVQAYGRAGNKPAAKRHIIRRARALGAMDSLPEKWGAGKTKKYALDVMDKLQGADLDKAANLHLVSDMLHALACVETLEEQLEIEYNEDSPLSFTRGITVNVSDDLLDRMGKLLIEFGDVISEVLEQLLDAREDEENREIVERSEHFSELIKAGARYSKDTKAIIQAVMSAVQALYDTAFETVVKPPHRTGTDPDASSPGHSQNADAEVTVKPRRRAGSEPTVVSVDVHSHGSIAPYKDMSPADLMKALATRDAEVADLKEEAEIKDVVTDRMLQRIADTVAEKLKPLEEENARLIKELSEERTENRAKNARLQADITAIRNSPFPAPVGAYRVAEKTIDTERQVTRTGPGASEDDLRVAGNEAQLTRMYGPLLRQRP